MKNFIFLLALAILLFGCDKKGDHDCGELKEALVAGDEASVNRIINSLIPAFDPQPADNDREGFRPHFKILIDRLNSCDLKVTFSCYNCIDTNPPISELSLEVLSGPQSVSRTLDLMPNAQLTKLECKGIH